MERRYTQQIEQLTAEVGVQWETTNKLQLDLDKQRRENSDLRRECAQKQALIDELKKDMQNRIRMYSHFSTNCHRLDYFRCSHPTIGHWSNRGGKKRPRTANSHFEHGQ